MLENYFICINPYLLTASVRNPTQKTERKNKVNLSVQHNREGQFRINWLRESRCYQFSLSLRSLDAFLHVAGEIVAPKLISFTTPEQSRSGVLDGSSGNVLGRILTGPALDMESSQPQWLGNEKCLTGQAGSHGLSCLRLERGGVSPSQTTRR